MRNWGVFPIHYNKTWGVSRDPILYYVMYGRSLISNFIHTATGSHPLKYQSLYTWMVVFWDSKILCQQFLGSDWRDRQDLKRIISVAVVIVFFCGDEEVRKPRQRKHCQKSKGLARKGAGTFHIHRKTMKELGARAFLVHCLGTTELGTQLRFP